MMIIEGALSVKAAMESDRRTIEKVWIDQKRKSKDTNYIVFLSHQKQINLEFVSREQIDSLATGSTHGGVIAFVSTRKFDPLPKNPTFVLMLEGIEDPFNLGQCIRTAYTAGVQAIITPMRRIDSMDSVILKASAGASERISWIMSESPKDTLMALKEAGVTIVSALRNNGSSDIFKTDLSMPVCICIGGEKRGLSTEVIEQTDVFSHIEYPTEVKVALSATAAATIYIYEVVRQKKPV